MTLRIASDRVVHVWRASAFGVLRLGPSIDGEVACAAFGEAPDSFWVGLSDGRIACTSLSRCAGGGGVVDLADDFLNEEQTVSADVGRLKGLVVPAKGGCVLEAFGDVGWECFDGNRRTIQSGAWGENTEAVTHAAVLGKGRLRRAVAGDGAVLSVDAGGCIRVVRARSLADAVGGRTRAAVEADMSQPAAVVGLSPKGECAVIVGELRAVVVLYVAGGDELSVARAYIPGEEAAIDPTGARVVFLDDGRVRVSAGEGGRRLAVSFDADGHPCFKTESDELCGAPEDGGGEDASKHVGEALKGLLRGIEQAATLTDAAEERGRRAERRLASLNASLLFALQSNAKSPKACIECTFTGSLVPAAGSASFYVQPTWVGVNAFVNVELKSVCDIAVGAGWNVRLTVESMLGSLPDPPRRELDRGTRANGGENTDDADMQGSLQPAELPQPTRATQLTAPLPGLAARGTRTVSFPLALESHAPLRVSAELHYTLASTPAEIPAPFARAPARSRGLAVRLAAGTVLDALDFVLPVDAGSTEVAPSGLRHARLAHALGGAVSTPESLPLSSRIALPAGNARVLAALSPIHPPAAFTTFLGAACALEPGPPSDGDITLLTLRAPPDALPFLRAAVLRRVRRGPLAPVHAASARTGIMWANALRKTADEAVPSLAPAEKAVRDLTALADAVGDEGRLELCARGEDARALRRAVVALEEVTRGWRERARGVWDPAAGGGLT